MFCIPHFRLEKTYAAFTAVKNKLYLVGGSYDDTDAFPEAGPVEILTL